MRPPSGPPEVFNYICAYIICRLYILTLIENMFTKIILFMTLPFEKWSKLWSKVDKKVTTFGRISVQVDLTHIYI